MLKPYEYNRIKYLTFNLVNTYHSVNDKSTQNAVYATVVTEILELSDLLEVQDYVKKIKDTTLSTEKAEILMTSLKAMVEPFPLMSESQIKITFKKVKKLKIPATSIWDMREVTYFAWNEISSNRKYILLADGRGFYGTISAQKKNICAICQKTSVVTQFLATTKTGPDGTYTKNGTYICLDSDQCNRQIQSIKGLENFVEIIREK
jgi:hypothetical protein